jgi:acyl carrier protein
MTVHDRLQEIFRTVLEDDDLVLSDELTADQVPAWDSVAHVSLMFTVESEFGVQFDDDQLTSFQNVGELRRYVEGQLVAPNG